MSQLSNASKITTDLLPQKFGKGGLIWTGILVLLCLIGLYGYYRQVTLGLVVTNMRDYASWGIYISNFVFFVAISLVGSLITAIFRLAGVEWRTPLTRISEIIAVSAILFASIIIIVDMGRPERFTHLFLYARLQSPIMWDVIVITTYLTISVLFLYFPLLPDLPILIKNSKPGSAIQKILQNHWIFLERHCRTISHKRKCCENNFRHDHSRSVGHSHCHFMVVCYYVSSWMGQHKFRCVFRFGCIFSRGRRSGSSHVRVSKSL